MEFQTVDWLVSSINWLKDLFIRAFATKDHGKNSAKMIMQWSRREVSRFITKMLNVNNIWRCTYYVDVDDT